MARGRSRAGLRSSSMKYNGLWQPPYAMTIACKATVSPLNVTGDVMWLDAYSPVGTSRHAETRAKNNAFQCGRRILKLTADANAQPLQRDNAKKD